MSEHSTTKPGSERTGKILTGIVVSNKMKDTVVVAVSRFVKHPKYDKYFKTTKRYKAHDTGNTKQVGETVVIKETAPISKDKHFRVLTDERNEVV